MTRSKPAKNSIIALLSLGWCAIALGALMILRNLGVTLGQGSFFYRYSEVESVRLQRAFPLVAAIAFALVALKSIGRPGQQKIAGALAATLLLLLLGPWTWYAPPQPFVQHTFNMRSPSQDGAFFLETRGISSLRDYLRNFDHLIEKSPAQMGGTRVLSNPPGMTILTVAVEKFLPPQTNPPGLLEQILLNRDVPAEDLTISSTTIRLSIALTIIWMAAGVAAYALARLFLPAPGALLFALIACFNPCTVHFVPGKDPAQLLTINLMMLAWMMGLRAIKQNRPAHACPSRAQSSPSTNDISRAKKTAIKDRWLNKGYVVAAISSGIFLTVGLTFGLIHFWIALALLLATCWEIGFLRTIRNLLFPALIGAAIVIFTVYFTIGWNIPATLFAVARRFPAIQQTFALDRSAWFFIGLPLFLLFVSPGLATTVALTIRRRCLGFGTKLALCTAAIMLATYLTVVTYELPRLWVAFLPPLTLGVMIDLPLMRATQGKPLRALMLLAALQIAFTAVHWSQLDARESEYRLITQRFFN